MIDAAFVEKPRFCCVPAIYARKYSRTKSCLFAASVTPAWLLSFSWHHTFLFMYVCVYIIDIMIRTSVIVTVICINTERTSFCICWHDPQPQTQGDHDFKGSGPSATISFLLALSFEHPELVLNRKFHSPPHPKPCLSPLYSWVALSSSYRTPYVLNPKPWQNPSSQRHP